MGDQRISKCQFSNFGYTSVLFHMQQLLPYNTLVTSVYIELLYITFILTQFPKKERKKKTLCLFYFVLFQLFPGLLDLNIFTACFVFFFFSLYTLHEDWVGGTQVIETAVWTDIKKYRYPKAQAFLPLFELNGK